MDKALKIMNEMTVNKTVKVEFATSLFDSAKSELESQVAQYSKIKMQMGGFADDLKKIVTRFNQVVKTVDDMEVKMKELGFPIPSEFNKVKSDAAQYEKFARELANLSIKARQ